MLRTVYAYCLYGHSCERDFVISAEITVNIFEISGNSHHGGIVGSEEPWRYEGCKSTASAVVGYGIAYTGVGRYTSAYGYCGDPCLPDSLVELVHQYVYDCLLERGGQIGTVLIDEVGVCFKIVSQGVQKRCFESAETVIETGDMWFCEFEPCWVSLGCEAVDVRAAGIRQTHHLGTLVEGLSGGIVDGATEDFHVIIVAHEDYLAVPS